jgi:hypothetical protein
MVSTRGKKRLPRGSWFVGKSFHGIGHVIIVSCTRGAGLEGERRRWQDRQSHVFGKSLIDQFRLVLSFPFCDLLAVYYPKDEEVYFRLSSLEFCDAGGRGF